METTLKKHITEGNWEAIHYLYDEVPEELRLQYAYPFGRAYLHTRLKNGIKTSTEIEQLSEAFRIALYDYRMINHIWKIAGSDLINLMDKLEQKAREHIDKSGNGEPDGAKHSRLGSEYYLLSFYLFSDRQLALKRTSKEASWNSLLDMLVRMKVLGPGFMSAIIAFLRLYNAIDPREKLTSCSLWIL